MAEVRGTGGPEESWPGELPIQKKPVTREEAVAREPIQAAAAGTSPARRVEMGIAGRKLRSMASQLINPDRYGELTKEQLKEERGKLVSIRAFLRTLPEDQINEKMKKVETSLKQLNALIQSKEPHPAQPPPATVTPSAPSEVPPPLPPRRAQPPPSGTPPLSQREAPPLPLRKTPPTGIAPPPQASRAPQPLQAAEPAPAEAAAPGRTDPKDVLDSIEQRMRSPTSPSLFECVRYAQILQDLDVRTPDLIARKTALLNQIGPKRLLSEIWITDVRHLDTESLKEFRTVLRTIDVTRLFEPSNVVVLPENLRIRLELIIQVLSREGVEFVDEESRAELLSSLDQASERFEALEGNLTSTSCQDILRLIDGAMVPIEERERQGETVPSLLQTARKEFNHLRDLIPRGPQGLVEEKDTEVDVELLHRASSEATSR